MKASFLWQFLLIFSLASWGCSTKEPQKKNLVHAEYDEALANQLGADQYGMKNYIVCFLKPGKLKIISQDTHNKIKSENKEFIRQLVKNGHLVMLGHFTENKSFRMQLVLNVSTVKDAQELVSELPKVKEGLLIPEFTPWYGPAALAELKSIHNKISKTTF